MADVIVADMTGRNANVFYEVGYAHALGKIVLLVTQSLEDIPFDLKHRPHIIYGGEIAKLRSDLTPRIRWAIAEAKKQGTFSGEDRLIVSSFGLVLGESEAQDLSVPLSSVVGEAFLLSFEITNGAPNGFAGSSHMYILSRIGADLQPCELKVDIVQGNRTYGQGLLGTSFTVPYSNEHRSYNPLSVIYVPGDDPSVVGRLTSKLQYRLPAVLPALPPGAVERIDIWLKPMKLEAINELLTLRMHTPQRYYDFLFRVRIIDDVPEPEPPPEEPE